MDTETNPVIAAWHTWYQNYTTRITPRAAKKNVQCVTTDNSNFNYSFQITFRRCWLNMFRDSASLWPQKIHPAVNEQPKTILAVATAQMSSPATSAKVTAELQGMGTDCPETSWGNTLSTWVSEKTGNLSQCVAAIHGENMHKCGYDDAAHGCCEESLLESEEAKCTQGSNKMIPYIGWFIYLDLFGWETNGAGIAWHCHLVSVSC